MTVFLPLEVNSPLPSTPSFLSQSSNVIAQLQKVVHTISKAKRIVVICGAGISVQAGIPDFRSPEGLFRTLKRDNPRENLASGKDLFDASVFNSENTTSLFCQMIAQLSKLSHDAEPTPFHRVLRALDDHGKLLRVYTQNIDALEQRTGLSFGVPGFEDRRGKNRLKGKGAAPTNRDANKPPPPHNDNKNLDHSSDSSALLNALASTPTRLPSPPAETPRCIPLHGTVQYVHCQVCTHSFPLQEHLSSLAIGQPPQCPECTSLERTRQLIGKRPRGIGKLRPSVVLYNEAHRDGEGVGEVVRKDLMGSKGRCGADLLLVVGTSLRVPGTKRMVREFSKAVRSRVSSASNSSTKEDGGSTSTSGSSTPSNPSTRPSPSADEEPSMKAVYVNLDFPVPTREWEGVFDTWLQGDAQQFAQILQEELEKQAKAKELAIEKKRKRDEEAALAAAGNASEDPSSSSSSSSSSSLSTNPITPKPPKRKSSSDPNTSKRRKIILPPSPPKSPPTLYAKPDNLDVDMLPSEAGPSSSSPSHSPRLMIRIPPRSRTCYIDLPPVSLKTPLRPAIIKLPPTPEDTPPSRFKLPVSARTPPRPRALMSNDINDLTSSIIEIGLSEDEIDDYDALPISCMRSTQVGLSSAG
ncbi:DHS-like NAD/FAD-binding domain-containing protein [Macrolepiota fuliginosa MF-IS2]|uniref:DHS-like NAD/FAD-binding domain-containing protein n=1 Tax=Macrolepiota fuliginosa MF-IS2 TaxID=1400762 RepID=A0A9P5XC66_9AGAR|nr:DHS-like NAD/FAD-binding domain-containing protein [Macrolepiota fuliginosa MF-IS2]